MSSTVNNFQNPFQVSHSFALPPDSLHRHGGGHSKKLDRIVDELLDLNKLERHDYAILFRHKMGLHRYGPAPTGPAPQSDSSAGGGPSSSAAAAKEKAAFDVNLEKFDSSAKLKVIKEIRAVTDLDLKEVKDLVKAPAVVKRGV